MTALHRTFVRFLTLLLPLASAPGAAAWELSVPTFNRDVAPIIHRHCAGCHREDEIGPFPLVTYGDVRKRAQMVRQVTETRYMPPWNADPAYASFVKERWLSDREIAVLAEWTEAGAPEGTGTAPPLQLLASKTNLGVPDLVVGMREAYEVQGNNRDDWRTFAIPVSLDKDAEVKAVVIRPGNRRIVHHAMLYVDESGAGLELDRSTPGHGFSSWQGMKVKVSDIWPGLQPGMDPIVYPPGISKRLPASCVLLLSMHYAPSPRTETDQTRIELYFADTPPRFHAVPAIINERYLVQESLFIPAGTTRRFELRRTFEQPLTILTVYPHMHYRGKTFLAYAALPGTNVTVPLLKIDAWDFNWQSSYTFREPVRLPAGTTLHVHAMFDNRAENPANPEVPPVDVHRGRGSYDEMLLLGLELLRPVPPGDDGDSRLDVAGTPAGSASPITVDTRHVASGFGSGPADTPDTTAAAAEPSLQAGSGGSQPQARRSSVPWLLTGCIALGVCCLLFFRLACNALASA